TATATPAPSLAPDKLAPGSTAVTVSDRLRVRSQPRVAGDSIKFEPLLPTGTELLVIEGPVSDSGYDWYRVAPVSLTLSGGIADGWVAAADHDGTPWIALGADPLAGLEFARATLARADGTPADARRAATSINAFALELYRQLRADPDLADKGLVFSPASIALALAMARAGARGETAAEMDAVLHTDGWEQLAAGLNALDQLLASRNATWTDDGQVSHALSLRIANAAFGQRGYAIEQGFLDAIAEAFGAQLGLVDFKADPEAARKVINAWVSRQTAQRIPELLLPPEVTDLTRLALVNAIYLKANWMLEFDKESTADRVFTLGDGTKVRVPTMSLDGGQEVPYASGSGWKATELRYLGADDSAPLAMTLVLPDDIDAFEKGLTTTKLASIVTKLGTERTRIARTEDRQVDEDMACPFFAYSVQLFMPRFGIDTRANLVPVLEKMGMKAAVNRLLADFSGITPEGLYISAVIHQANIDVDEKGTEAAAATAVMCDVTGGCGPAQPLKTITLRLNRPFLFVLRDVETGAILFMGRVLDPSTRK
ncbi:MAG: serpin family protein, partial [Chloroflexota bacterium]|nr:serpin family protein [Chloroflexota bacterium]